MLRECFLAIAKHIGIPQAEGEDKYHEFISSAKSKFSGLLLNKQVLERVKRKTELNIRGILNSVPPNQNSEQVKASYSSALDVSNWNFSPSDLFNEENEMVLRALAGGEDEFIKIFPGKTIHGLVAEMLGVSIDRIYNLISSSLNIPDETERQPPSSEALLPLKSELISALSTILPMRSVDNAAT